MGKPGSNILKDTRKPLVSAVLLFVMMCFPAYAESEPIFPDVPGWSATGSATMVLRSAEEEEGLMARCVYMEMGGRNSVRVIFLEGRGTEWLSFPEGETEGIDGPVGTGATYRKLEILGKPAVFENHPVQGLSLAVKLEPLRTLTLETSSDETLLFDFARALLELIID